MTTYGTTRADTVRVEMLHLCAGYRVHEVLHGVSWQVAAGSFCGIIGPNGAGKTTLVRVLGRFIAPWRGSVVINGRDVRDIPIREYARLVAVATRVPEYARSFTVAEFLALGRYPFGGGAGPTDRRIVAEILQRCDAAALADMRLNTLSSGEVQRVAVAQAIAQTPRLLLLDEPTAHLDISHQVAILDYLRELSTERGMTIVGVFHDLNLASEYCDNLLLLSGGHAVRAGTPHEVLTYDALEAVYRTTVVVKENPISGKPYVFPVPAMWREGKTAPGGDRA